MCLKHIDVGCRKGKFVSADQHIPRQGAFYRLYYSLRSLLSYGLSLGHLDGFIKIPILFPCEISEVVLNVFFCFY